MSVIVTFCLYDGIVMAADSRTTLTKTYPDERQEVSHKDGIKKIFRFGDRDIGILWCENAQVVDGVVTHKNMNPELGVPTICVVWDGQRDISKNIIRNSEKLDIGGKIVDESEVPHFTLDEGVRFAEAMLKRSCKEREECGESKYSLVMAGAGLQWIHK